MERSLLYLLGGESAEQPKRKEASTRLWELRRHGVRSMEKVLEASRSIPFSTLEHVDASDHEGPGPIGSSYGGHHVRSGHSHIQKQWNGTPGEGSRGTSERDSASHGELFG